MSTSKMFVLISAVALVFAALASCGAPPAAPTSVPTAVPTAAAEFPIGRFVNEVDPARGMLFNEDGTWAGYYGGVDPVAEGTYKVEGDLYTEATNGDSDPNCQGPATYQWHYDGTKLTFTPVSDDPCKPRRDAYSSVLIGPR